MIQAIYTSLSGMLNHRTRMDVLSNNIANINTTGFKAAQANFQDSLYRTMRAGTAQTNPAQQGLGVTLAGVITNFIQGPLQPTGRPLDLAISGNGFFGLKKDEDSGDDRIYYTREGSFYVDKKGHLVNSNGLMLVNDSGSEIELPEIDKSISSISATQLGEVVITYGDGTTMTVDARIGLYDFPNPNGLTRIGSNLYSDNNADQAGGDNPAGNRIDGKPGENGLGVILSGYLEMANIDLANELGNLIVTQRGYEANAKVFTTSDEVLKETIDLKR